MSARVLLQAAVVARLKAHRPLVEMAVFDAPPARAGVPFAVVDEAVLVDRSAQGVAGLEGRLVVTVEDGGERPVRLRALIGEVEETLPGMAAAIGEGWRVVTLVLVRSRMARAGERWRGVSEFAVRMYRENG